MAEARISSSSSPQTTKTVAPGGAGKAVDPGPVGLAQDMNGMKAAPKDDSLTDVAKRAKEAVAYQKLRAELPPDGQAALDDLQAKGKLSQLDLSKDPKTLLENLMALSNEQVAKGLNKSQLLDQAVVEADDPTQIQQSDRDTCGATTFEYMLDTRDASEFVRLLDGVAGKSGQVTTMTGSTLSRDDSSIAPDDSGRLIPDRLMQSAFMKYGRYGFYRNSLDGNHWYSRLTSGLTNGMFLHLDQGVLGEQRHTAGHFWDMLPLPFVHQDTGLVNQIQKATDKGQVVPVSVNFNGPKSGILPAGHFLLVTRIKDGRVYFRNPWGTEAPPGTMLGTDGKTPPRRAEANGLESMTESDFVHILVQGELPGAPSGPSAWLGKGISMATSAVSDVAHGTEHLLSSLNPF